MTRVETTLKEFPDGFTIRIPKEARCLFPKAYEKFIIKSDFGKDTVKDTVYVTEPPSHPHPHIHVTTIQWFRKLSPKPKDGDKVVIEVTESKLGREYRLISPKEQKEVA